MNARRRFLLLALVMIVVCATAVVVTIIMLYRFDLDQNRRRLQETAKSQARLIEAIARNHAPMTQEERDGSPDDDLFALTMIPIADAHERYEGFGETGEFTLARHEGGAIAFALRHRHDIVEQPQPIPFDSDLAEPMRRALKGLSDTMIGLDYRGKTVLAAHEPVAVLNMGIVAKIDLAEIRMPFIRAGCAAAAVALLIVLAGAALFLRATNPIVARLEAHARDLENEIRGRKNAEETMHRSKRLASIGTLAAGIAHEFNNPLGLILMGAQRAIEKHDDPKAVETSLHRIKDDVKRCARIVKSILQFSRDGTTESWQVDLNQCIRRSEEFAREYANDRGVQVRFEPAIGLPKVIANPTEMEQVFVNVIHNAAEACTDGQTITLRTARCPTGVQATVSDQGRGMTPEEQEHAFDPFYSNRQQMGGTGLGLSIVHGIITGQGGTIDVDSRLGEGTRLTITLPTKAPENREE